MTRDFKFENVICKGKKYGFVVHNAVNFSDAKKKAVNWCIKKLNLDKSDFKTQLDYLNQNIEKGETKVIPIQNQTQNTFDFDKSFDKVYEELYSGLLKENETN